MNTASFPKSPMKLPPDDGSPLTSAPMAPAGIDQATGMLRVVVAELEKLDPKAVGVGAVADATNGNIHCLNFLRGDVEAAAVATFNGFKASMNAEVEALESVGLSPNERDQRMSEAFERTIGLSRDRVTSKLQAQSDALASTAVTAMQKADAALSEAWAKATGPLSLTVRLTIDDAVSANALKEELRPQRPATWLKIWEGFVSRGQEREELLAALTISALASAVLSSPPAKLSTWFGGPSGGLSAPDQGVVRGDAQRCLQALEVRQLSTVPPHLAILQRAMAWNAQVFSFLCGSAVVHLNARELEARFSRGSVPPLEVHPLWVRRYVETMIRAQAAK